MNDTETYLRQLAKMGLVSGEFVLEHGRAFEPDLLTFKGWTGEPKNCYGNATHLVLCGSKLY